MWRASRHRLLPAASPASSPRARRGLSLLEAVAALAIVGATSAGALAAAGSGLRTAERARRAHEAEALAQEVLAQATLADAATLRALPDSLAAGAFAPPFDEYRWRLDVVSHPTLPGLFDARVTITWADGVQQMTSALFRRPTPTVVASP